MSKFAVSAVAKFGDVGAFFGGLDHLIGPVPHPDVERGIYLEHCEQVGAAFGNSTQKFTSPNYGLETTPKEEYEFVVSSTEGMSRAGGIFQGKEAPDRQAITVQALLDTAVERMKSTGMEVTQEEFDAVGLSRAEVIALRLYTGPCYILYNAVLRAKGREEHEGKFTTTIHLINSGVLKLSRLQHLCTIYRGIAGKVLPDIFRSANKHGGRGGVEFGFMSSTSDRSVALGYAGNAEAGSELGTLLEMKMGMYNKGCQLDWLSQYPQEREILFAPLAGIEVMADARVEDGVEIWPVQLCVNLRSVEIEKLVMWRKSQHLQMLDILYREVCRDGAALPGFKASFLRHMQAMAARDGEWFNHDANFSDATLQAIEKKQNTAALSAGLEASFDAQRELHNFFTGSEQLLSESDLVLQLTLAVDDLCASCPPTRPFVMPASARSKDSDSDFSVYVGPAGLAYLMLRVASVAALPKSYAAAIAQKARLYLRCAQEKVDPDRASQDVGFLCGEAGVYALASVIEHLSGNERERDQAIELLLRQRAGCDVDELLYGRSGYLWALLFVWQELDASATRKRLATTIQDVFLDLIERGGGGRQGKPLTWTFNPGVSGRDNNYLGAAHGDAGILLPLLQAQRALEGAVWAPCRRLLLRSIDYLLSRQLEDGNFPASVASETHHKVHWCHGAPGCAALFRLAHEVFGAPRHAAAARKCAEVCWHRGILKKGAGLCHGVSGNAYPFLQAARLDSAQRHELVQSDHYFRASCFARIAFRLPESHSATQRDRIEQAWASFASYRDRQRYAVGSADFPHSLFEGRAGAIYFLADLLEPEKASFPGYELETNHRGAAEAMMAAARDAAARPGKQESSSVTAHPSRPPNPAAVNRMDPGMREGKVLSAQLEGVEASNVGEGSATAAEARNDAAAQSCATKCKCC